jgi:hypothetical protein
MKPESTLSNIIIGAVIEVHIIIAIKRKDAKTAEERKGTLEDDT